MSTTARKVRDESARVGSDSEPTQSTVLKRRPKGVPKAVERVSIPVAEPNSRSTEIVQQVISIPIEKLHRHPSNRTITADSVAELVQSLQDHGQREPIRVREHPERIGHYEIISGERRYVAAQQVAPRIDSLHAIVETLTDSTSLVELAVANAARQDLTPIERAELLRDLITPIDQGGGGMDRAAAGRIFNLNSESGVKNTLRLLKLPEYLRTLLETGKVSVGQIRPLCAYPDAYLARLSDWIEKSCKGKSGHEGWAARRWIDDGDADDTESLIGVFNTRCTRPVGDKRHKHNHGYQAGGEQPCLFDLEKINGSHRTELQIVEIPDGEKGVRTVALNVKLWHELQDPLVAAKVKSKSKPIKETSRNALASGSKAPTAAELKAKRKKQDEQLKRYTDDWTCKALRCTMANRTPSNSVSALLPWLLCVLQRCGNVYGDLYAWASAELGVTVKRKQYERWSDKANESYQLQQIRSAEWWVAVWRVALWPVASRNDTDVGLATIGTIPDRLPILNDCDVHELAATLGVSIETVWQHAAEEGWERSLVLKFLEYHTKDQLSDLAKSLKITLQADKRGTMAAELLEHHKIGHGRQLHLPAVLQSKPMRKRGAR